MDVIKKINAAKTIWHILPYLTIDDLERAIETSAQSYYNTNTSLLSDETYDVLVSKLKKMHPKSIVLKKVGAPVRGPKVMLPVWMGSMDKIKTDEKMIDKWAKTYRGGYIISDKLDGISCLLTMVGQKLSLYTRGNGQYGQLVTHLASMVNMHTKNLLKLKQKIYIRGELIMPKDKFRKYSKIMSNARNMVAGIVNSKKDSINRQHASDVDFVAYEIIEPRLKPSDQMSMLKEWDLLTVEYDSYPTIDLDILQEVLKDRKKSSIYEIDGIIVTDDHMYTRNESGNPPYSFAFKGITETADVKVIEVLWKPSKDGILVPRIHYEKVRLSQANLSHAMGFNAKFIVENKIGPGAIITIVRSGDTIPYVMEVVSMAKKPDLPTQYDYIWDDNQVNIILKNASDNETVIIRRLTKFMRNIGVENMSEKLVGRLVANKFDTIPKIMKMTVDDFLTIEGFQEKLGNKLFNNLQKSLSKLNILTLMVASNIFGRGFGPKRIKKILDSNPKIVHEYSKKTHNEWKKRLLELEGFDDITVNDFLAGLPEFQEFYHVVQKIVNIKPYNSPAKKGGLFAAQNVVFTGFRNKDWEKFIEDEGGKVSSSVSTKTNLLVFNDGDTSSSKYTKAVSLGVETMPKSEFGKKFKL